MNINGNWINFAYIYNPTLYGSGNAIQHLHYLPFGEDWVDQRNSSWNAPYTFSGKEKDAETDYGYFGARYYDSGLSIWLSVDPMSDKYPSMSPYNYCANNPVILVDPDGEEVWLLGSLANEAFLKLQDACPNMSLSMDKDGKLLVNEICGEMTEDESKLFVSILNPEVKANVYVEGENRFNIEGSTYATEFGGCFVGNKELTTENGKIKTVEATQFISMTRTQQCFPQENVGKLIMHEITEAYMGGLISIDKNQIAPKAGEYSDKTIFNAAHNLATPQPKSKDPRLIPDPY